MLKIAVYFPNKGLKDIDLSTPESGNPGIGGTQFNFVTLAYYFEKFIPQQVEWTFVTYRDQSLPEHVQSIRIDKESDISKVFEEHTFDYFIWKPGNTEFLYEELVRHDQPAIAWLNNVPNPEELGLLARTAQVKRAVFAGHEALDLVRDHAIINKSTVIFNGFDPKPYLSDSPVKKDPNLVIFLGSLVPAKCFHLMADAWPEVLKKNPSARLLVIGSGQLYNRNNKLGPFKLAEEDYEKRFIRPLLDGEGNLHPSVTFAGLMGKEKIPLMQKATVGVINPHGKSEVCPGSAIEFQACSTPVVAGARYGNLDVIKNKKTGLLVSSHKQLVQAINQLLANPDKANQLGKNGPAYIDAKFSQERIVHQWKGLLQEVEQSQKPKIYPVKSNLLYNLKIIFELLRILKFKIGIFKNIPSIYEYIELKKGNK